MLEDISMAVQQGSGPGVVLYDLITSQRTTAVIYVTAKLGIADILAKGPKTGDELAERTGAHRRSLQRLLRALIAIGICRQSGDQSFELTEVGSHLADTANPSLKAWALFEGESLLRSWGGLLESIRTGKSAAELEGSHGRFESLARNPEAAKNFDEAMVALTGTVLNSVISAYDFSGIRRLMDVGGGYGQLLITILTAYPSMRGAVFDLPHCADGARRQIATAGLSDRCEFMPGSVFDSIPTWADALILKSVINSFGDERIAKILQNCRSALTAGGRLLLVERIMPDSPQQNPEIAELMTTSDPTARMQNPSNAHEDLLQALCLGPHSRLVAIWQRDRVQRRQRNRAPKRSTLSPLFRSASILSSAG